MKLHIKNRVRQKTAKIFQIDKKPSGSPQSRPTNPSASKLRNSWFGSNGPNWKFLAHTLKNQRDKEWLDPKSDSSKALQTVVLDKTLINDLKHLTRFSHTGSLEVYHSLLNKWVPQSTHFSYEGMIVWSQIVAVDFSLGCYCLSQWVYWKNLLEIEFIFSTHQEIATK